MTEVPEGLELLDQTRTPIPSGLLPVDKHPTPVPKGLMSVQQKTPIPEGLVDTIPHEDQDDIVNLSPLGRILDAFGQGAKDGWGAEPIGLSPDTEKALRDFGIFKDTNDTIYDGFKIFNQAMIRPVAAGIETIFRAGNAIIFGLAREAGEFADVTGLSGLVGLPGERLTRDIVALTDAVGVVTGTRGFVETRGPTLQPKKGLTPTEVTRQERQTIGAMVNTADVELPTTPRSTLKPPPPEKAGNINLDRILAGDDVKEIIRETAVADDFTTARRGKMTFEDTSELADALGMTTDELIKRKIGTIYNAEEALSAGRLLVQSAEDVWAKKAKVVGGNDNDLMAFQEAMMRHMAIQEQVSGATAEVGRALSAQRILRQTTKDAEGLSKIIEDMGGRASVEDIARKMDSFDSPQQMSKFLSEARKATKSDMVVEAWINALLSGPQTHVTNILSNTLTALIAVPERGVAAIISSLKGQKGPEKVRFGEAHQKLFGIVQGAQDGVLAGWKAFKTERPTNRAEKLEVTHRKAIPSATFKVFGKEVEVGGKQLRIPGRALTAADEFFKAIGYRQELNALAYRAAANEGLQGKAFSRRMAELVENPTKQMRQRATDASEYQTYTKKLGEAGQSIQKLAATHPALKIPLTFIRTPVNILKYAGERTPLALLSQKVRASLRGQKGPDIQNEQWARLVTGSAVATAVWKLAAEGNITGGGPTDPRQRALLYLSGWQPYSVKVNDINYSYARMEPFGILLGVTTDILEVSAAASDPDIADVASLITGSISKNLVSKVWLKGPSDLIEAVNDPDRYGSRYIRRLLSTVVPTGMAQVARVDDPFLREARTIVDAIKSRVPGLSADLLPRRDIWGEPVALEGSLGPDILSPIYMSELKNDPVNRELLELGVYPSRLRREIRGIELTDAQYDDYQMVSGRLTKTTLDETVNIPGWATLPEFARVEMITNVINGARNQARSYMLMSYPNILQDYIAEREAQAGISP